MSTPPTTAYICPNHPWIHHFENTEHKFVDGSWQDVPITCPIDGAALIAVPIPEINPGGTVRVPIVSDESALRSILEPSASGDMTPGPAHLRKDWAQRLLDQLDNESLRAVAFEKDFSGTPVVVWGDPLVVQPPPAGGP